MKQKLRSLVRKIFLRAEGGLRPAWRAVLGILLSLAACSAVLYGLAALFGALFDAWGLTTANLTRAPHWVQSIVRWHSDFCYALAYGAGIAVGALWARRFSVSAQSGKAASETADAVNTESAPAILRDGASAKPAEKGARSHARAAAFSAKNSPSDSHAPSLRAETSRPADYAQEFRTAIAETTSPKPSVSRKPVLFAALLGLLLSGGLGILALTTDCMRVESPWSAPHFSFSQLSALLVLALGRLLSEMLTKRLCFDALCARSRRWAWMASVALATLLNLRGLSVLGVLNALLMAVVGCALYERGGLLASTALQTIWAASATLLLGFPGMSASATAVWPLYHVSDAWLTGGNAGPMSGAWFTLLLSAALLILLRQPLTAATQKLRSRSNHLRQKCR